MLNKFSNANKSTEFTWPDVFEHQVFPNFERIIIGCKSKEIPLLVELAKNMKGPFGILYVLTISRTGKNDARYQSKKVFELNELEEFLYLYQNFFEQDGRHNLWIMSLSDKQQLIFDKHNLIYAYGNADKIKSVLVNNKFANGAIEIPSPHAHHYHHQFDNDENSIINDNEWIETPLQDSDDD